MEQVIIVLLWAMLYFLPCIIAVSRKHKSVGSIIVINAFLGWTGIAWICCFAWCFSGNVNNANT